MKNNQKVNYQKELDKIIEDIVRKREAQAGYAPTLLLHACCAPCSSYCMEYLREYFEITVFFYNPNITDEKEYRLRVEEEIRLIRAYNEQVELYTAADKERGDSLSAPNQGDAPGDEDRCALYPASNQGDTPGDEDQRFELPAGMHVTPYTKQIRFIEGSYDRERFLEAARGLENCPEGGERCGKCFELRLKEAAMLAHELGMDYVTTTLTISPLKDAARLNEIGQKLAGSAWLPSDFKKKNGYKRSTELSSAFDLYRQNYCGCGFSKAESLQREAALQRRPD